MAKRDRGPMLTAAQARCIFSYNPVSGFVRWKITPGKGGRAIAGARAGTVSEVNRRGVPYRRRQVSYDGRIYKEHLLIWLLVKGRWPRHEVDHRDNDGANNRWSNLRPATRSEQTQNARLSNRNRAGLKWVRTKTDCPRVRPYQAVVGQRALGYFATPEEAHAVAVAHARRCHGEFFNPGARACKAKTKTARKPPRPSPKPRAPSGSRTVSI